MVPKQRSRTYKSLIPLGVRCEKPIELVVGGGRHSIASGCASDGIVWLADKLVDVSGAVKVTIAQRWVQIDYCSAKSADDAERSVFGFIRHAAQYDQRNTPAFA